jgi:Glycosyltransferase family 87
VLVMVGLLLACGAAVGAVRASQSPTTATIATTPRATSGRAHELPTLSTHTVLELAGRSQAVKDWIAGHPVYRTTPQYDPTAHQWTVYYVSRNKGGVETTQAEVLIDDNTAEIQETRTGPQVAWMMARGYWGAFGRHINDPWIWSGLCALFFIPLVEIRRILSWRTLDLLALLSFSLSLIWFNAGEVLTSVPLVYPPLAYLAVRMALIGTRRVRTQRTGRPGGPEPDRDASHAPSFRGWAPTWLLIAVLMLSLGLRYSLNAFDSNVIDVGYAGVIGAHQIVHGVIPYGTFPAACGHCDTYGPLTYMAVVPFEVVAPWHGSWDSLPAAHAAATAFDVLCVVGLLTFGWRLGGFRLGLALATAWAAFPFTAYALESNTNDALVAAMLIWGLVVAARPLGRGLMLGLAIAAKLSPAILIPLWWRHPYPRGQRRYGWLWFVAGLALAILLTGWVILLGGLTGIHTFWTRTVSYQLGRQTPFSIWGQYPSLRPLQLALIAIVAVAALAVVRWPRERDLLTLTALSGTLMIGLQLTLNYWFYLYIPWFLPFVLVATVPHWPRPLPIAPSPASDAGDGVVMAEAAAG